MSRKNIRNIVAENYNEHLCLEVAYYESSVEEMVEKNLSLNKWYQFTYDEVHSLQLALVENMNTYPYIVTTLSSEWKFMLAKEYTSKRNDEGTIMTKKVVNFLVDLLDRKVEIQLAETAREAMKIQTEFEQTYNWKNTVEISIEEYWNYAFTTAEALTEGLRTSTKIKVFENLINNGNSFYEDSYEEGQNKLSKIDGILYRLSLESAMNPLVSLEKFDSKKFITLRELASKKA